MAAAVALHALNVNEFPGERSSPGKGDRPPRNALKQ